MAPLRHSGMAPLRHSGARHSAAVPVRTQAAQATSAPKLELTAERMATSHSRLRGTCASVRQASATSNSALAPGSAQHARVQVGSDLAARTMWQPVEVANGVAVL
eukprot:2462647-Rhodomonas_salina.1